MKLIVTEDNNQLSYQIDGKPLPSNSAIHEYKHLVDIDHETWQDLEKLANGDLLNITYMGTSMGFAQFSKSAPVDSTVVKLEFVDYSQQLVKTFITQFTEWLGAIKATEAYQSTEPSIDIDAEISHVEDVYSNGELMHKLTQVGQRLVQELLPDPETNSLEINWQQTAEKLTHLEHEKSRLTDVIQKLTVLSVTDLTNFEESSSQKLVSLLVNTEQVIQQHTSVFDQQLVDLGQQTETPEDSRVFKAALNRYLEQLGQVLISFQESCTSMSTAIKPDNHLSEKVKRLLQNVTLESVNIKEMQTSVANQGAPIDLACDEILHHEIEVKHPMAKRLLENTQILLVNLTRVVTDVLYRESQDAQRRAATSEKMRQDQALKVSTLTENVATIDRQIDQAVHSQQLLMELRKVERLLPPITLKETV